MRIVLVRIGEECYQVYWNDTPQGFISNYEGRWNFETDGNITWFRSAGDCFEYVFKRSAQ